MFAKDFCNLFEFRFKSVCISYMILLVSPSLTTVTVYSVLFLSGRTQKQVIDYVKEAEYKKHPFNR